VTQAKGYRISLRCDTCGINRMGYLLGRGRQAISRPFDVVDTLCTGWAHQHEGHEQIVLASPALIDITADLDDQDEAS
jgi:hypothetical protein